MTVRERYDRLVRHRIGPELRGRGFKRLRNRFVRWSGSGWAIIDFQASDFGDRDRVLFTVNLATALEGLPKRSAWDATKPPTESFASLRERLGPLMAGRDHWWHVDERTDTDALANELLRALDEHALPWLEARATLDDVLGLAASRPDAFGWEDLRALPRQLDEAGHVAAADALRREVARREAESPCG